MRQVEKFLDVYDTICLTISANDDEIVGRTTLQKLIYFAKVKIPEIHLVQPYTAYFYGPFNREVAIGLEKMVALDFLEERRIRYIHASYSYRVSEKGIPKITRLRKKFGKTFTKIESIVDQCYTFCKLNPYPLSFAAKVHFMLEKNNKGITYENLAKMAKGFGWEISQSDVKSGTELLQQLNLVKILR